MCWQKSSMHVVWHQYCFGTRLVLAEMTQIQLHASKMLRASILCLRMHRRDKPA